MKAVRIVGEGGEERKEGEIGKVYSVFSMEGVYRKGEGRVVAGLGGIPIIWKASPFPVGK